MAKRKGNREIRKPKQGKDKKTETNSVSSLSAASILPGRKK